MNQIASINILKMTSREIAEVTGKRHPDVKRDIRAMFDELKKDASNFAHIYRDEMNRQQEEYQLDREHTECLITGYSAVLRMSVIKRLRELEAQAQTQQQIPQSFPEALRLAAELAEENQKLTMQITTDAPKVDFADRVEKSSGVLIGDFGKAIGIGQNRLFACLRAQGYLIATAGTRHNTPYQRYIDSGHFDVTEQAYETPSGETRSRFTPHITGKGQVFITTRLKECGMIKELE